MLQHENMLLKQRVEELQKQVSDLSTTNEFLLDQNAQLRMGVKQPSCGATTVVNAVPATQISVPQPATAGVISVQPATISMGGQPTPMSGKCAGAYLLSRQPRTAPRTLRGPWN